MKISRPIHSIKKAARSLRAIRERHRARHRSTGLGFLIADSVDFLDAPRWDELTRNGSVWMRRDVLRIIERQGPENLVPRYAMIFRDGIAVAALAVQIVQVTGRRLQSGAAANAGAQDSGKSVVKRLLGAARKIGTKRVNERLLVAGNLLCWGFHGITMQDGVEMPGVWSAVGEALYRIRRAERLTGQTNIVMIKDFTAAQSPGDALHRLSYRPLETEPDMVLAIQPAWRSYEDYLGALDSKNRSGAKSQMKKLAAAGVVIERITDLRPCSARLHELYCEVQRNASVKLVTVPEDYLPGLAQTLGESFRCHIARRGDEILGFVTSLRDRETTIAYYIGFDREAASQGIPIYLRLLHAPIGDAIDWRTSRLSLGRTALEPKAALGAKPEPLSVWLRHRVPAMNWIIRGVLDAVPHNEPPERNPFRTVPGNSP